ncbi:MAG TPA: sulfatase-like hydrolase/transferase [Vicinamibacteria bacterium]|nr:sulfatase-like hydrolase/transferase [Vicinamibacteria bacterium]
MGRLSVLALACLAAAALVRAPAGSARPCDVVLVTLDTLRADRVGFLGSRRGLTPTLDRLAGEGVVFEQAFAQAPLTTVSHATVLSGMQPPGHGVRDFGMPLPVEVPWLPSLLRAGGYRTAAFVGSMVLDPGGPIAPGFDRGFDVYDAGFRARKGGADPYQTKERRGAEVVRRALGWLEHRPAGPLFLWVHLYDAHDPYDPPEPFRSRFAQAPYDGEVAAVDAAVGALLGELGAAGVGEGAVIAVAGDHGESLGAHGEETHGVFLYDETIHVPLLLRLPGAAEGGRRVAARVGLVDLAPTLLEAAGVRVPAAMQGRSLVGLARGVRQPERPSYAESEYPQRVFGWSSLAAWRDERFLFVEAPRRELYDLRADPSASRDLAAERPALVSGMAAALAAAQRAWTRQATAAASPAASPELLERLASLGYAGGTAGTSPAAPSGIDPKDRIAVSNLLHDATLAGEEGRWRDAIPLYERVVASDPQIFTARLELGLALAREKQWARALPHLRLVAERMPDYADARFTLGLACASLGRRDEALRELRAALAKDPRHAAARQLLQQLQEAPQAP